MNILAIETSCDDTACAIVADGRHILSNTVVNQNTAHQATGGVVPEVAAREHIAVINNVIEEALQAAKLTWSEIDAIAATLGPGLVGSLLVGVNAAKTLSWLHDKPFIPVHHLVGHVCANLLESDLSPPFTCLLVSGGHTQLMQIKPDFSVTLLGETLDDAVGEAYDKVGRVLGLGFPGGPAVDKLATAYVTEHGQPPALNFPIARTENPYNFSYSGLKTAVARHWEKYQQPTMADQAAVAAAFQHAALKPLIDKTVAAALSQATAGTTPVVAVCGGVSANRGLRAGLQEACKTQAIRLYLPKMGVCTDNAAMIASAAYFCPLPVPKNTDPHSLEVFSRGGWPVQTG